MRWLTLALAAVLLSAAPARAATYWVATNGSPNASCTAAQSQSTPKASVQDVLDTCISGSGANTIIVRDGTYTWSGGPCGSTAVCLTKSGSSAANRLIIKAEHYRQATISGNNFNTQYGFQLYGSNGFIEIDGFDVQGFSHDAFIFNTSGAGGSDFWVTRNRIHAIGKVCDQSVNGKVGVFTRRPRTTIEGNELYDIGRYMVGEGGCTSATAPPYVAGDHGIYAAGDNGGAHQLTIINNVFHDLHRGWPIQLYPGAIDGAFIANNTFAFAQVNSTINLVGHIIIAEALTNCEISNNISYSPREGFLHVYDAPTPGCVIRNNLVYNANLWSNAGGGGPDSGTVFADPQFVSPGALNFLLQASSPAVDTGFTLARVPADYAGLRRPQGWAYDRGAFETGGAPTFVAAPTGLRVVP